MNKIVAYTDKEKILLAALVDAHNLVEDKKTDAATIQKKQLEWKNIAKDYNAQGDVSVARTDTQLKKLWNNLKQKKRKANTLTKYNRLQTGGGPPPEECIDLVMEAVDAAAPHVDVTMECPWDSTALFEEDLLRNSQNDVVQVIERDEPPSTPIPVSKPRSTRKEVALLENECNLRVKKIKLCIEQQTELHEVRIKIEESALKKSLAEQELSELILEKFKRENSIL